MHLLIDGYGGDVQRMQDREILLRFLDEYPSALGMHKLCEPSLLYYDAPEPGDSGLSAFVIIAESHISVHTFPQRSYINMDIFSCRSFDHQRALQDVKDLFLLQHVKSWVVDRGLEHYDPQLAAQATPRERVSSLGDA